MKYLFCFVLFLLSANSFAINYKLVEKEYKGKIVKYYEDDNKRIIDTMFKLKKEQDYEILYVFSYNCSTCYVFNDYEKQFEEYAKNNRIRLEKLPLYLGKEDINKYSAQLFFTRKYLKFNKDFDSIIFDLVHIDNVSIQNEENLKNLFTKYAGIERSELDSDEYKVKMNYRLNRVIDILKELDISTTPTLIIHKNGKRFMIDATTAGTPDNLLFTLFAIIKLN